MKHFITVVFLLLVGTIPAYAYSGPGDPPCAEHPDWERHYSNLDCDDCDNYDATYEAARIRQIASANWLRERGCPPSIQYDGDIVRFTPNYSCEPSSCDAPPRASVDVTMSGTCLPACEDNGNNDDDLPPARSDNRADSQADSRADSQADSQSRSENNAGRRRTSNGCELPPRLQMSPASAHPGAAVTGRLLDQQTSQEFRLRPGLGVSWSVSANNAEMTIAEPNGRTGSSYTVISDRPGNASITVMVCGQTDSASVSWVKADNEPGWLGNGWVKAGFGFLAGQGIACASGNCKWWGSLR